MMEQGQQQSLANSILEKLNQHYSCVLAGGAVRDWYFNKEVKDLDFFVLGGERSLEEIQAVFPDKTVELATAHYYPESNFQVFNVGSYPIPVQIILDKSANVDELMELFPSSLSKAWYDGESCYYHPHFLLSARYNHAIVDMDCVWEYHLRVSRKLPEIKKYSYSLRDFLKSLGGKDLFGTFPSISANPRNEADMPIGNVWVNPDNGWEGVVRNAWFDDGI